MSLGRALVSAYLIGHIGQVYLDQLDQVPGYIQSGRLIGLLWGGRVLPFYFLSWPVEYKFPEIMYILLMLPRCRPIGTDTC